MMANSAHRCSTGLWGPRERVILWLMVALCVFGCRLDTTIIDRPTAEVEGEQPGIFESLVFTDVTAQSGVDFTYRNGSEAGALSIVESLGGGVGLIDFDRDGRLDLFFPGGGALEVGQRLTAAPHGLFRQLDAQQFEEVSTKAGARDARHYSHGCTVGDFDNDGFPDLVVTAYGGLQLLQNMGDGTFRETQEDAGLTDSQWSSSAAWGDLNGDGNLDLYVAHYVDWSWENHPPCRSHQGQPDICPPRSFSGLDDVLYLSNGDGTFRDVTREAGLVAAGKGLGVVLADLDHDGDVDVYVANDTDDNFFYLNDGQLKLREVGRICGLATDHRGAANGSMGIAVLDYNRDQLADVWVTNYERESFALYRNEGAASFTHVSEATGIDALGSSNVGFGTAAGDIDGDGDEDLVVANGHVIRHPESGNVQQQPLLLIQDRERFQPAKFSPDQYFGQRHHGRGLALGDLDNDGDLDCVFSHVNDPATILRNDCRARGGWLGIRLTGRCGNRDAVGTNVLLETNQGAQFRTVVGGGSYLSHNDGRLLWRLQPGVLAIRLQVDWPSGKQQVVAIDEGDRYIDVAEP